MLKLLQDKYFLAYYFFFLHKGVEKQTFIMCVILKHFSGLCISLHGKNQIGSSQAVFQNSVNQFKIMIHIIWKPVQFLFFKKLKQIETISEEIVYCIDFQHACSVFLPNPIV